MACSWYKVNIHFIVITWYWNILLYWILWLLILHYQINPHFPIRKVCRDWWQVRWAPCELWGCFSDGRMGALWLGANTALPVRRSRDHAWASSSGETGDVAPAVQGGRPSVRRLREQPEGQPIKLPKLPFALHQREGRGKAFVPGSSCLVGKQLCCVLSRTDLRNLNSWCPTEVTDRSCGLR